MKIKVCRKSNDDKTQRTKITYHSKSRTIKTVLQIATAIASIITVFITGFSFWETHYKNELDYDRVDGLKIERLAYDYENETFISNNQIATDSTFMYSLVSTDNSNKYSQVKITPILYIYLKNRENDVLDSQFALLDKLYIDCTTQSTSSIIAFMDYPYSSTLDDLYRYSARYYNHPDNDIYVDADIIYKVDYKYLNNRNKYQDGQIFLTRDSDFVNLLSKKKLMIDMTVSMLFQEALIDNSVKTLESLKAIDMMGHDEAPDCFVDPNKELIDNVIKECFELIETFQNKHGIIEFYNNHQVS